jgi:hypothetical protein
LPTTLPALIAIENDDHHAELVGKLPDGRQFFITNPFTTEGDGNEFLALYIFDEKGGLVEAWIDEFGPRDKVDLMARERACERRLSDLGEVTFGRIEIAPFAFERFGTTFGLLPNEFLDGESELTIKMMPGEYMTFRAPWDSGEYDVQGGLHVGLSPWEREERR